MKSSLLAGLTLLALTACSTSDGTAPAPPGTDAATPATPVASGTAPASAAAPVRIVALGDSQTAGAWLANPAVESWPAQLGQLRCPDTECVVNQALGGQPLGLADPTLPAPLLVSLEDQLSAAGDVDVAVVLIGQLDLVKSDDTDQVLAFYIDLDARLRAAGVGDVAFITLLPFDTETSINPEWIPAFEARRTAINDGLRAQWGPTGQLIDLDVLLTEPDSAEFRAELALYDGNHPSVEGARIIAMAVDAHLDVMLAG